jgi:hypothetical protein
MATILWRVVRRLRVFLERSYVVVEFIPVPYGSAKWGDAHNVVREIFLQHVLHIQLVFPRMITSVGDTLNKVNTTRCRTDKEFKQRIREEMSADREEMTRRVLGSLRATLEQCLKTGGGYLSDVL